MSVGEVRNVRQLRGRLVCDVVVGSDDDGRSVTLHVEVNPFASDVKPALDALQRVLRDRAFASVSQVHDRRERAKAQHPARGLSVVTE